MSTVVVNIDGINTTSSEFVTKTGKVDDAHNGTSQSLMLGTWVSSTGYKIRNIIITGHQILICESYAKCFCNIKGEKNVDLW